MEINAVSLRYPALRPIIQLRRGDELWRNNFHRFPFFTDGYMYEYTWSLGAEEFESLREREAAGVGLSTIFVAQLV